MHYLFWYLKDNIADPQFGQRYQVILGGLLSVCGSLQRDQFTKQDELVVQITEVAEKVVEITAYAKSYMIFAEVVEFMSKY